MLKYDLLQLIHEKYASFYNWYELENDDDFEIPQVKGKWSPGQHLEHIRKSTKVMCIALNYPRLVLWYKFGRTDRVEQSYDQLRNTYRKATLEGFKSPKTFIPKPIPNSQKWNLIGRVKEQEQELNTLVSNCSESYLSKYQLPHPVFGKLTVREMLLFVAYHTEHHQLLLEKYKTLKQV